MNSTAFNNKINNYGGLNKYLLNKKVISFRMSTEVQDPPVLHVLVVGFHHKKGCTVEYSHPPLMDPEHGDPESPELPSQVTF